jgi:formate-dependent phosphoribosylglycinamide formyltransferase (GAR transformylase)
MRRVVFVAPFAMEATLRFVRAAARLPGVSLGLVTQEPLEKVPAPLRHEIHGHWRVADALDPAQIVTGAQGVAEQLGGMDRLIGTLEQLQVPIAEARERLGLPGLSVEAAENFRDKARMKTVLRNAGIPCARHRLAGSASEAWSFAQEVGYPLVVKPPAGAGAKATFRVESAGALGEALAVHAPTEKAPVLLEEFVVGDEHSFDTVSLGGKPVWHSLSHYRPTPLEVLRHPWIQWCVQIPREVDHPRYDDIRRVGFAALSALGMGTGVTHMEWFRRPDGSIAVSEVAARPPGAQFCTLISFAHDIDFYAAWARTVIFDAFDPPERRYSAGAAYLRGQGGKGRVRAVHGLREALAELGHLVVDARLPIEGQAPTGTYEGEGYVVLRHPDTEVVRKALDRLISTVRVELAPN